MKISNQNVEKRKDDVTENIQKIVTTIYDEYLRLGEQLCPSVEAKQVKQTSIVSTPEPTQSGHEYEPQLEDLLISAKKGDLERVQMILIKFGVHIIDTVDEVLFACKV